MSMMSLQPPDVVEHTHHLAQGKSYTHTHAYGSYPHGHMLRAICHLPECEDFPAHNIHLTPKEISK